MKRKAATRSEIEIVAMLTSHIEFKVLINTSQLFNGIVHLDRLVACSVVRLRPMCVCVSERVHTKTGMANGNDKTVT